MRPKRFFRFPCGSDQHNSATENPQYPENRPPLEEELAGLRRDGTVPERIVSFMSGRRIESSRDYFTAVVTPNYETFFEQTATFASAVNLVACLVDFHRWLFDEYADQLRLLYQAQLGSAAEFWDIVRSADTKFECLASLLGVPPKMELVHHAPAPTRGLRDVEMTYTRYASPRRAAGRGRGPSQFTIVHGETGVPFEDCVADLHRLWSSLLARLGDS
ncbi:hypothetical protein [Rubellimicrobium arenae]|uniref:hypothetical protein n=1 Tax=Rubellimicrobium arenae TaxID=2817372 RepID=UPI001B31116E|nr:hypothetical protein [Rubellimicrobium arenae]